MGLSFRFPALALAVVLSASAVGAKSIQTPIGTIRMDGELPDRDALPSLFDALDFQQATQSYLWALPLVAFAQWQAEHREKFGADSGDLVIYQNYEDKLGILTANATTPYIIGFIDLAKTGPMVIELPPGPTAGGIGDMWQRSVSDIGQTGPDKGQGGKYLIVPPGQTAPADATGYFIVEAPMMNSFVGFRVLDPDPAKGKALVAFYAVLRMYQPRVEVQTGQWTAPPLHKAD